ncbi:hypothetical protein ACFLVB_05665 [Chloroflexota bacterium]
MCALLDVIGITVYSRMAASEAFIIGQTSERNQSTIPGIYYFSVMETGASVVTVP